MPLNAEEKYQHEKFKQKQYSRPTLEQVEIARLEQQLQHAQNTICLLDDYVDKQTKKIDQLNSECKKYQLDQQSKKEFSRRILQIMGWAL